MSPVSSACWTLCLEARIPYGGTFPAGPRKCFDMQKKGPHWHPEVWDEVEYCQTRAVSPTEEFQGMTRKEQPKEFMAYGAENNQLTANSDKQYLETVKIMSVEI